MIEKDDDFLGRLLRQERTESARRLHENRHIAAKLRRIFDRDPNWGAKNHPLSYEPLATALAKGIVSVKVHSVDSRFLRTADRSVTSLSGESFSHRYLKSIGKAFLYSKTYGPVFEEYRDGGRRYDLAAPEDCCILECGNSNVEACISILKFWEPGWRYFQMPYQPGANRWFQGPCKSRVFIFEFSGKIPLE